MILPEEYRTTIRISDLPGEKDSIHKLLRSYYYKGHTRRGFLRFLWRGYVQPYALPWRYLWWHSEYKRLQELYRLDLLNAVLEQGLATIAKGSE